MKKRIIAVFLALCIFAGVFSVSKRAHAAGATAVSAVVAIGLVAWELLDLMIKGEEPGIVVAMREFIESGVDGLTNPDSAFQQNYSWLWEDYGGVYEVITNIVTEMYENGEIAIKNGKIDLTYDQFQYLYSSAYSVIDTVGLKFSTPYDYTLLNYHIGSYVPIFGLPADNSYFYSDAGQGYCLCYYDDEKIVFSPFFAYSKRFSSSSLGLGFASRLYYNSSFQWRAVGYNTTGTDSYIISFNYKFCYHDLGDYSVKYEKYDNTEEEYFDAENCFVVSGGVLSYASISSVDVSGMKTALVSTTGDIESFIKSITSSETFDSVGDTLTDLADVLPVEENPVLSFPISPDLSLPVADQVTVTTPTAANVPIADYLNPVITDIETPSIILEKFPFCIPYDFIRIIGVLAADPVAPVFHIPISTHPKNLEQFAGNETIGDYISPEDPMFEIDEEIVIDLSHIPLIQPICYTIFIVGFVIFLIKLTPRLIQH